MNEFNFQGISQIDWLSLMPEYAKDSIRQMQSDSIDEYTIIESWLSASAASTTLPYGTAPIGSNYSTRLKVEFNKLICGDPAYSDVRKEISSYWNKSNATVISVATLAISSVIGIAPAVIIPPIALLFSLAAKIGVNAWCAADKT